MFVRFTDRVPTVEPVVSEEKLRVLLAEAHESAELDYKQQTDLSVKRSEVELAKDLAAMQVLGGFVVIGADDHGRPSGLVTAEQASLFDESRLRAKMRRWLPEPLELRTASHTIDRSLLVVVSVGPNPAGFVVMANDGRYDNDKSLVFRKGDVYVRHGTASELWQQEDIDRIIARRVEAEKEAWRAELSEELRRVAMAATGTQLTRGSAAGVTWQLDAPSFDSVVLELLRADDDVPLRLLLGRAPAEAKKLLGVAGDEDLATLLDRVAEVGALALFARRQQWLDDAVGVFVAIYELGFALQDGRRRVELWLAVIARVFAVGGLAVRQRLWPSIRVLVLQHPRGDRFYANWVRHAHTQAARAGMPEPDPDGKRSHLSFVDVGNRAALRLEALRIDSAGDDDVLDSVVQFDALAALTAGLGRGESREFVEYYPTFHLWYSHRVEPALVQLIDDSELRHVVAPDLDDAQLASALVALERPPSDLRPSAPWVGYESPELTRFIHSAQREQT
jgi:Putative DNA-binding domain